MVAIIFMALAGGLFLIKRRYKLKLLGIMLSLLVGTSLIVAPLSTVYAQTAEECVPDSSDEGGQVLGLVDDSMSVPGEGNYLLAILNNDNAPDDDPLDWQTVDLNPALAGQQTSIDALMPNEPGYICGSLSVTSNFGLLAITLLEDCYYELPEDNPCWEGEDLDLCTYYLPLPEYITLQYTADTLSGQPAPAPATVTILIDADTPDSVVMAAEDSGSISGTCDVPINDSVIIQILDNDITSSGTLDPTTVDLNPSLPGRQTTVTINASGGIVTATVDNNGNVIITTSGGFVAEAGGISFYYTVENSNGDTSNIGVVSFSSCTIVT